MKILKASYLIILALLLGGCSAIQRTAYMQDVENNKAIQVAIDQQIRIKPLDCSKCMTFWAGTIYALAVGQLTLGLLLYILTLALLTSFFASVGGLVLLKLENFIQRWES